jgi:hypothetical protein
MTDLSRPIADSAGLKFPIQPCSRRTEIVGQREFMDVHDDWMRGKSISEIARQSARDRKTIRRLLPRRSTGSAQAETDQLQARPLPGVPAGALGGWCARGAVVLVRGDSHGRMRISGEQR